MVSGQFSFLMFSYLQQIYHNMKKKKKKKNNKKNNKKTKKQQQKTIYSSCNTELKKQKHFKRTNEQRTTQIIHF